MPVDQQTNPRQNSESVAFRVPASLKQELTQLAAQKHQSLGELMRAFSRERLALERHRTFKETAQSQSRQAAAAARDPGTDEHAVMRELQAELDELPNEWS